MNLIGGAVAGLQIEQEVGSSPSRPLPPPRVSPVKDGNKANYSCRTFNANGPRPAPRISKALHPHGVDKLSARECSVQTRPGIASCVGETCIHLRSISTQMWMLCAGVEPQASPIPASPSSQVSQGYTHVGAGRDAWWRRKCLG